MIVDVNKRVCDMSADELKSARLQKLQTFVVTMWRPSVVNPAETVYADLEELSYENIVAHVKEAIKSGWKVDTVHFERPSK